MGRAKELWYEAQHNDKKNWRTKKCKHCGESFKYNLVTKPMKAPELGWCDECYDKIILGKD